MKAQKSIKKEQLLNAIIVFVTIGVIVICSVLSVYTTKAHKEKGNKNGTHWGDFEDGFDDWIDMDIEDIPQIKLTSSVATYSVIDNTIRQTLTATVMPESALNKKVDWSVSWLDESIEETVTDYITVETESDGNATATVICHGPFESDIVITVTTRESGFSATCLVAYKGLPTEILVNTSALYTGESITLGVGNTYDLSVEVTNAFDVVGEDYKDLIVSLDAIGSVILATQDYNRSTGSVYWYEATNKITPLAEIKDDILTVNYENGIVSITTKKAIESYYSSSSIIDGGRTINYKNKFREYSGECYFSLKIKEPKSNLIKNIKIVFDETLVTGVTATKTEIYF